MADPYFFGYGSLVNSATHDFADPHPARLAGWRRAWRHTDLRQVAFLTAIPDPGSEIEGMIAHVPGGDWEALDQREWAYDRLPATAAVTHTLDREIEIAVYAVPDRSRTGDDRRHPILMSYLDVVVQGYLREFGIAGAERFFATTDGWEAPILNDRAAPRYPRNQALSPRERQVVDDHLALLGATVVPAA
ncbi:gamma-glutamylcyclotransferase family protein [Pseudodonghicola flavimaris]|uniref:Gamma-glutamylcyclotransferase family protein n=1 Tax=Pseudodonghicola flavimaris TaxID=3050036 RepID=A0ABT7F4R7_9RHOB|nr:gamma-glutamylcyclotransferase family protein [Pseudodonghicola flavimaris]MDK3019608.1 gamma-glutamylcyclotransferase family protein [Pseudodonghicola flavimaris]